MKEKKSVDLFFRKRDYFYEALLIAFVFTIFLTLVFAREVSSFNKKLAEKKLNNDNQNIERFLVHLEKVEDTLEKSQLISTNSQRGRGRIKKSDDQHLVGKTKLSAENNLEKSFNLKYLNLKNNVDKKIISASGQKIVPLQKNLSALSKNKLAVETKNKLEMHFWIDENDQLRASVEKRDEAAFFLELGQQVINRFVLYFNSQRALNYLFLKQDNVATLVRINQKGEIAMVGVTSKSQHQPYLDYIASRTVSNLEPLKNTLSQNGEDTYVMISFNYTGPPLRRWRVTFEVVEN